MNEPTHTPTPPALDAAITRALDTPPAVLIPSHFAARVRASLPAQPAPRPRRSVSHLYAGISVAVLLVTLCILAPHTAPSFTNLAFDLELILLVELAGTAGWLTRRHNY